MVRTMQVGLILMSCVVYGTAYAQEVPLARQKFILFPHPMNHKWTTSIGVTATTMPYEVTEELHYRIPAGDLRVLRKLSDKLNIEGQVNFQVLQNLVTMGPKWTTELTKRTCLGVGNDVGFWFGFLNIEGFKTKGMGWQNFPYVSLGYRFNKQILLTFKADAIMTLQIKTWADNMQVTTNHRLFSGSSTTIALEQPFYGKKSLTLGFRAIYTNFFWQTWTAFENFDREFFYPQLVVGLIL